MTARIKIYDLDELAKIADALLSAAPDGRPIVVFPNAKVNFRAQVINHGALESDYVWCRGAIDIKRAKNDIYTINGTVAGRDAFSYTTQVKEWLALPFPREPSLAGFRQKAPVGAQGYLGDVIIMPYRRE